ncbi:hypothetical protein [Paenarthrobacter sp. 22069]|uniref:hypothetical protein n=1 Tax=Paenarthrobacter sp. 22069 TaxID=3453864 RepID=UPI003F8382A7
MAKEIVVNLGYSLPIMTNRPGVCKLFLQERFLSLPMLGATKGAISNRVMEATTPVKEYPETGPAARNIPNSRKNP